MESRGSVVRSGVGSLTLQSATHNINVTSSTRLCGARHIIVSHLLPAPYLIRNPWEYDAHNAMPHGSIMGNPPVFGPRLKTQLGKVPGRTSIIQPVQPDAVRK